MRAFIAILFCIILTGCGSMNPIYKSRSLDDYSLGVQILERNKKDIKKIKDRTADDLALGRRVRELREEYPNDRVFVQKVEDAMAEQESYKDEQPRQRSCDKLHISSPVLVIILLNIFGIVYVVIKISKDTRNRSSAYAKRKDQNSQSDS